MSVWIRTGITCDECGRDFDGEEFNEVGSYLYGEIRDAIETCQRDEGIVTDCALTEKHDREHLCSACCERLSEEEFGEQLADCVTGMLTETFGFNEDLDQFQDILTAVRDFVTGAMGDAGGYFAEAETENGTLDHRMPEEKHIQMFFDSEKWKDRGFGTTPVPAFEFARMELSHWIFLAGITDVEKVKELSNIFLSEFIKNRGYIGTDCKPEETNVLEWLEFNGHLKKECPHGVNLNDSCILCWLEVSNG